MNEWLASAKSWDSSFGFLSWCHISTFWIMRYLETLWEFQRKHISVHLFLKVAYITMVWIWLTSVETWVRLMLDLDFNVETKTAITSTGSRISETWQIARKRSSQMHLHAQVYHANSSTLIQACLCSQPWMTRWKLDSLQKCMTWDGFQELRSISGQIHDATPYGPLFHIRIFIEDSNGIPATESQARWQPTKSDLAIVMENRRSATTLETGCEDTKRAMHVAQDQQ